MEISQYINNGRIDERKISIELRKKIQKKVDMLPSERHESIINELVLNFIQDISDSLSDEERPGYISHIVRVIIKTVRSFGISNVNIPVDLIAQFMGFDSQVKKRTNRQDKRKAVLDAGMVVFSNKGFHDAKVDEIAELAGVAKGTVYRYFESKEEILKEIIRGNNTILVEGLSSIFSKNAHILELVKEAIAYYVNYFESNKELYKILTHTPWIIKEVNEYFYNSIISHLAMIRRRILSLNKDGVIKTTDFYTVFYGIFGFIDGVMQKWFRRNCDYSLKDELPVIIEVLFYGFVGDNMREKEFLLDDRKQREKAENKDKDKIDIDPLH